MIEPIAINEKFAFLDRNKKYLISNYGRVYSVKTDKFLKLYLNSRGYCRFKKYEIIDGKQHRENVFVHLVVVMLFGDKFGNKFENMDYIDKINVDHRDGNKLNNKQSNLQLVSAKCNQQRKYLDYEEIDQIEKYKNIEDIF